MSAPAERDITPELAGETLLRGVLDSRLPVIAANWLADGYDSEPLRELAGLPPSEAERARALLVPVLRSLGVVRDTTDLSEFVGEEAVQALGRVGEDLVACGYVAHALRFCSSGESPNGVPNIIVGLDDDRFWAGSTLVIAGQSQQESLVTVADSAQSTLGEVECVVVPICRAHGRLCVAKVFQSRAMWWCEVPGEAHGIAEIGSLGSAVEAITAWGIDE